MDEIHTDALRCSFCGKYYDDPDEIIAGPGTIAICKYCNEICLEMFEATAKHKKRVQIEESTYTSTWQVYQRLRK